MNMAAAQQTAWSEVRERHLEKMLLAFLFLVLIMVATFTQATWPENMANMVLGALIGIITGRASNSRAMDPGNRSIDQQRGIEKISTQTTNVKVVEEELDGKKS